jgi:hypothetical protein
MGTHISTRDLAYSGLFGAAALLLPTIFHVVHLGHVFMPMYLPLVALAFLVGAVPAALTALIVPLLSGAVTGMPPLFPPVAICMAIELGIMAAIASTARQRWPRWPAALILVPVLLLGRAIYAALAYGFARVLHLPAGFLAGVSILAGWPGIVLMLLVIPPIARVRLHPTSNQDKS